MTILLRADSQANSLPNWVKIADRKRWGLPASPDKEKSSLPRWIVSFVKVL